MAYLQWWYGEGWRNTLVNTHSQIIALGKNFSLDVLLRTLFAPWKQVEVAGGRGLQKMLDKLISRLVGFSVRIFTLLAAGFALVFLLLGRTLWIILWPLLPLTIPVLIIYSVGVIK